MSFVDKIISSWTDVLYQTRFKWTNRTKNQEFPVSIILNQMLLLNRTEDLVKLQLLLVNVKHVYEMSCHLKTLLAFKKCKSNVLVYWNCKELHMMIYSRTFKKM